MARKGQVQWHMMKRVEFPENMGKAYERTAQEVHYALRVDGVLLKKNVVEYDPSKVFAEARKDFGWKVANRKPQADAKDLLTRNGYKELR